MIRIFSTYLTFVQVTEKPHPFPLETNITFVLYTLESIIWKHWVGICDNILLLFSQISFKYFDLYQLYHLKSDI